MGCKVLRVTRDEPWAPRRLGSLDLNLVLASTFEWGIGLHDIGLRESSTVKSRRAWVFRS